VSGDAKARMGTISAEVHRPGSIETGIQLPYETRSFARAGRIAEFHDNSDCLPTGSRGANVSRMCPATDRKTVQKGGHLRSGRLLVRRTFWRIHYASGTG
jgi:hypothetical protein